MPTRLDLSIIPDRVKEKKEAPGEVLNGDHLVSAPFKLDFMKDKESEVVCKKKLSKEEVAQFRSAVMMDYYFQMYYDDLPIWGFIGKVDREGKDPSKYKYFLYKHVNFDVLYNGDRVIEIKVWTDPNAIVDLTKDKETNFEFLYSVKWEKTNIPFEKRMNKISRHYSHTGPQERFRLNRSKMPKRRDGSTYKEMCSGFAVIALVGQRKL